jgi:small multidrug resistance family-3 protein
MASCHAGADSSLDSRLRGNDVVPVASTLTTYALAAVAEIAGCFAVWAWLRHGESALWLIPGAVALGLFAWLLTKIDVAFAGRAYAAYGGIYIAASLAWMWTVESRFPDRWDILGALVCCIGALIIIYGPRTA